MQNKTMTVCVTGAAGYVGSWIVKTLLDRGHNVHATVRVPGSDSCKHLTKENLSPITTGKLTLFAADLLVDGSFAAAIADCDVVIHSASPFLLDTARINPQQNLIDPAVKGTMNVLTTINQTPSVTHVILTSSIVAVAAHPVENTIFDENYWSTDADLQNYPYELSKRLAEQQAWEIARAQSNWSLTCINPGLVMGPSLSARVNDGSVGFFRQFMSGKYILAPQIYIPAVDVRDVAEAHVLALEMPQQTKGQRFICVNQTVDLIEAANLLDIEFQSKYYLPKYRLPKTFCYLLSPFLPYTWKKIAQCVGVPFRFSNAKIRNILHLQFRPMTMTLNDMAQNLIDLGIVKKKS